MYAPLEKRPNFRPQNYCFMVKILGSNGCKLGVAHFDGNLVGCQPLYLYKSRVPTSITFSFRIVSKNLSQHNMPSIDGTGWKISYIFGSLKTIL
jgi:hypothetical protein